MRVGAGSAAVAAAIVVHLLAIVDDDYAAANSWRTVVARLLGQNGRAQLAKHNEGEAQVRVALDTDINKIENKQVKNCEQIK